MKCRECGKDVKSGVCLMVPIVSGLKISNTPLQQVWECFPCFRMRYLKA